MMKGYLQAHGIRICDKRVGAALNSGSVAPGYHRRRQQVVFRHTNPVPYYAECVGHKLHIDQNIYISVH